MSALTAIAIGRPLPTKARAHKPQYRATGGELRVSRWSTPFRIAARTHDALGLGAAAPPISLKPSFGDALTGDFAYVRTAEIHPRDIAAGETGCRRCENRQYGYWDARLRDGFHFEPVRRIAKRRLEHTRQVCKLLGEEMEEDKP